MKNSNDNSARSTNRATKKRDEAIEAIARNILEIETLAERKSDSLDFHEVSVWGLRDALLAAYELGLAVRWTRARRSRGRRASTTTRRAHCSMR